VVGFLISIYIAFLCTFKGVVETLIDLGTFFHVEDRRTKDVHGSQMFSQGGWPPLANLVMKTTHSANYELSDLPRADRDRAIQELQRLKRAIESRAKTRLRHSSIAHAGGIVVGWKAPITMVLLPLLKEVFGKIKYLHVVRDGRDVSLSDNMSPVRKFYNTYYNLPEPEIDQKSIIGHTLKKRGRMAGRFGGPEPPELTLPPQLAAEAENSTKMTIKAMQLWNDWNQQTYDWGKSHSNGEDFDYLTIRSEDIVNPDTKLEALLQLADFVGSRKSLIDICCMSKKEVRDLGKSTKSYTLATDKKTGPVTLRKRPRLRREDLMQNPAQQNPAEMMDAILHGEHVNFNDGTLADVADAEREVLSDVVYLKEKLRKQEQLLADQKQQMEQLRESIAAKDQERKTELQLYRQMQIDIAKESMRLQHHELGPQGDPEGMAEPLLKKREYSHSGSTHHVWQEGELPPRRLQEKPPETVSARARIASQILRDTLAKRKFGPSTRDDVKEKESSSQVMARYGKWVKKLEDQPLLSKKLHELGASSLKTFGYEPPSSFLDPPDPKFAEQCKEIVEAGLCENVAAPPPDEKAPLSWRYGQK